MVVAALVEVVVLVEVVGIGIVLVYQTCVNKVDVISI